MVFPMLQRLLNTREREVHDRLQRAVHRYGAHVFPKVRLADVFKLDGSGILGAQYRFALQSHFDFVVTDSAIDPIFAVEFDGPSHSRSAQERRDGEKNVLCDHFRLPLLRIRASHVDFQARCMDLLSWFIHTWFTQQNLNEAQEAGHLPADKPFLASDLLWSPDLPGSFPLQLGLAARSEIADLAQSRPHMHPIPSYCTGVDSEGNTHVLVWLRVGEHEWLTARSAARAQYFPIYLSEVVEDIAVIVLVDRLREYVRGGTGTCPPDQVDDAVRRFRRKYEFRAGGGVGHAASAG